MNRMGLGFVAWMAVAPSPLLAVEGNPRIVFENQTKDFGKVIEGVTLKHIFRFTNQGAATLEIVGVEST